LSSTARKIFAAKVMSVRYETVNAMLLNECLREHRNVAKQQSTIAELKMTVTQQEKQIEALTSIVQKSERPSRSQQTCTTVSRQPLNSLVASGCRTGPKGT
jgi:uncharacterized coiled-coil protein SlyX